jgi:hypothetical protein
VLRRYRRAAAILLLLALVAYLPGTRAAQTLINLATQVMGILGISHGGTGLNAVPGTSGQLIYNNAGAYGAEDPIVSYNYVNLFNAAAATATATSSVTRVSTFSQYGTLILTWASITGSPSACTIQIKSADSLGNLLNNGSAISVTPSNGTTGQAFTPASTLATSAQMEAVYSCTTYPTAGTLSLEFVPALSAAIINTPLQVAPTGSANTASNPFFFVNVPSSASGAANSACDVSATSATTCKSSAGNVVGWFGYNPNPSACYIQFYNSSSPTIGTSPLHAFGTPATGAFNASIPPFAFSTAISVAETTTASGSTQCGSAVIFTLLYD